jgi:hypothetical protein
LGTPIIITEGLERAAKLISEDASHAAVGTGSATPLPGDSQLQEETDRSSVSNILQQGTTFQIKTHHPNASLPTTTEELGLFMNGSGSPNTGDMLVRVLERFTKESADLVSVFEITLSEA